MLAVIGWGLVGLLAVLFLLLVCPIRYRCEAGNGGGFLDVILLLGLYKKHIDFGEMAGEKPGDMPKERMAEEKAEKGESKDSPQDKTFPGGEETPEASAEPEGIPAAKDREGTAGVPSGSTEEMPEGSTAKDEAASPSAARVLLFAWENGTIHLALRFLREMYQHVKPQEFLITGTAGLGDPMETGIAAGCLYAALPGVSRIDWNYTEAVCRLTIKAKGRLIPAWILWCGARFLAQKPVREVMRYRKLGIRNEE